MSDPPSLLSLKDDLTCSICLCAFDYPVTIPCGHNFCLCCLEASWKDSYSCPQCRTVFATKPELKKNTTLCNVVESFKVRSPESFDPPEVRLKAAEEETKVVVLCDSCMEAPASHTCLTCMASYCEDHLRPHRENPVFKVHQLSHPIQDLLGRICKDHHKVVDSFCPQHGRLICTVCQQQVHGMCNLRSLDQQKKALESDLLQKCQVLDGKMLKNEAVLNQTKDMQSTLKNSAAIYKRALAAEYGCIRELLVQEELEAQSSLDKELETAQNKLENLNKKFNENIHTMKQSKQDISEMLSQSHTLAFLQTSFDLPKVATFDPHTPRISLESKRVVAAQGFAEHLKEYLNGILRVPLADRMIMLKKEFTSIQGASGFTARHESGAQVPSSPQGPEVQRKPKKGPKKSTSGNMGSKSLNRSMEKLQDFGTYKEGPHHPHSPGSVEPNVESLFERQFEKRSDLLKFGTILTFDPRTANTRIILSENLTKASMSKEPVHLPDTPERFAVCSQVLTSKGFSRGRHYWEVQLSNNNFIGIGLAYGSMNRKGPTSRLGRNSQSWCVEWFNVKLSAWHDNTEKILVNSNPKRVGVLVDCEEGTATFYNVADRAYPFHCFVFPFTETVYPAIWIFSSNSSVSLCKLH